MTELAARVEPVDPAPVFRTRASLLALMVTRRCNMTCAHCSVASGPEHTVQPSLDELRSYIVAAARSGLRSIQFTGGEPMLREGDVLTLMRQARRLGMTALMTTNGFWGQTSARATKTLRALRRAGLEALTISYDRYHAEFQGPEPALHIARAAALLNIPVNITVTRAGNDADLAGIVVPFEWDAVVRPHARLRFYDVQPVGRARTFDAAQLRGEVEGFCSACRVPAITDDGRVTACNGPSYFAPPGSPLQLGSLKEHSLEDLIETHATDPVLDTIRTFGPGRLRDELRRMPEFVGFPFRERYSGMCQLCADITSDELAVAALRARLSQEQLVAERAAQKRVLIGERRAGTLTFAGVNGTERARVFFHALRGHAWPGDTARILGRADLDWKRAAEYVSSCGLARPLVARLGDPALTRWAPPFFAEWVRAQATRDALRELLARDILGRLDEALEEVGAAGVLLKGAALVARATPDGITRAAGDIDLWVEASRAESLRARLIALGFDGDPNARRTGAHHLAPVLFRGIPVEIHTRLMPAFLGAPEASMLAHRVPVGGFTRLETLDREGSLLHAALHGATHLFSHGLKTAWDVWTYMEPADTLDWPRLARWIDQSAVPRAFWTSFNILCRELELEAPEEFQSRAPRDGKQARLEIIAHHRAAASPEYAEDINPFSKNTVFLMLCDTLASRARLITSLLGADASQARRSTWQRAVRESGTPVSSRLTFQARQAWHQWQDYRRVARNIS